MNIEVYYYTMSGNTKKLADAMASAVGTTAKDISAALAGRADILFLGSSLYAGTFAPQIGEFIEKNSDKIGTIVCFGSSASGKSTYKKLKAFAADKGVKVYDEYYNCPGHFLFLHKNRPNQKDMDVAAAFARQACKELDEKPNGQ